LNLLWLLLTMSLLVPENGASVALNSELTNVSKATSAFGVAASTQEQTNDNDELDDVTHHVGGRWIKTDVFSNSPITYFFLRDTSATPHPIRAPPQRS